MWQFLLGQFTERTQPISCSLTNFESFQWRREHTLILKKSGKYVTVTWQVIQKRNTQKCLFINGKILCVFFLFFVFALPSTTVQMRGQMSRTVPTVPTNIPGLVAASITRDSRSTSQNSLCSSPIHATARSTLDPGLPQRNWNVN